MNELPLFIYIYIYIYHHESRISDLTEMKKSVVLKVTSHFADISTCLSERAKATSNVRTKLSIAVHRPI